MIPSAAVRWLITAGRAVAGLALLSVSSYYLLASIPFANYHFLQFAHFWWLPAFVKGHAAIMAAGVLLLPSSLPHIDSASRRRLVLAGLPFAAWMLVATIVPAAQTYESAAALCLAPLALLAIAGTLDLRSQLPMAGERADGAVVQPAGLRAVAGSSIAAALLCASVYLSLAASGVRAQLDRFELAELVLLVALAGAGHLLTLFIPLGAWLAARALGRRVSASPWGERLTAIAAAAVVIAVLVHRVVLSTLLVGDGYGLALSMAIGTAVSIYWVALVQSHRRDSASSSDLAWFPIQPRGEWQWAALACGTAGLLLSVAVIPRLLLLADWGMAMQKSLVVAAWLAAITIFRATPQRRRLRAALITVTAVVTGTIVTTAVTAAPPRQAQRVVRTPGSLELTLQRYAALDPSMATMLSLLKPAVTDREYFNTVRTEGDRTDTSSARAVPLMTISGGNAAPAYRPHVFVIVVDSLRPDYLGPYNPDAAAFSPAISAFARDAVVFRNAFTPYAGTALSQPAIWAGGLIPRVNYVQPFSTLNSLEQLLERGDYRRYISMDDISRLTLTKHDTIRNLDIRPDQREDLFRFDLCTTAPELMAQLDRDQSDRRPIFAYTRPLNLHIRVVAQGYPKYEGVQYGDTDFFKAASVAIERLDRCFGSFIGALKEQGLYEDSVIIVTADHGDSYGEDGRWGHAYYLMAETLRVPLIMRVPARLAEGRSWATDAVALTTDLTPTLADLLGYGFEPMTPLAGRSLTRPAATGDPILVQSSYSRAYGLLDRAGGWLYVVNANQITESLYELEPNRATEVVLDVDARSRLRATLRAQLQALNDRYVSH